MTGKRNTLSIVILTWVNMAILVVNLLLNLQYEQVNVRSMRTIAETPIRVTTVSPVALGSEDRDEADPAGPPAAALDVVTLTSEQMAGVVHAVHVDKRVRARTVAVLQTLRRLEARKELRTLDRSTRRLILSLARESARQRAVLERELGLQDDPDLDDWSLRLERLDDELRRNVRERLGGTLDRPEMERVLRLAVAPRHAVATLK